MNWVRVVIGTNVISAVFAVACSASAPSIPSPQAIGVAVVTPPPSFRPGVDRATGLYSDDELRVLEQVHSSPGPALRLTSDVHVNLLSDADRQVMMDLQLPEGLTRVPFKHVSVLDGQNRGQTGWVIAQHLRALPLTPVT